MAAKNSRKTSVSILYNSSNVSKKIAEYLESISYEALATGGADSINITLDNSDERFNTSQMPKKGDKVNTTLNFHNWTADGKTNSLKCGVFMVDDVSFSGEPNICEISCVSMPVKGNFKNPKTKTFKKITIQELANQKAKDAGVKLHYDASKISIKEIEQSDVSDAEFLLNVARDYGLGMKIFNGKIVIYDEEKYEKKKATVSINKKDCMDYSWNTTMQKTYTEAKVSYTDPSDNKSHCITIGEKGRMLTTNVTAFSKKDAGLKAKAALANENKTATTMTLTIEPNTKIVETSVVNVKGFGLMDGKYFVEKIKYIISDGCKMSVEMRKVIARASMGSITEIKVESKKKKSKKKSTKKTSTTKNKSAQSKRKKTVTKVKRKKK